jgi:prophage DNA circulation protein
VATLHLSQTAAERAPAVRVETGVSLPSTLLAYDLYGDAGRAEALVDRNRVATSLVMPVSFEAVAP